METVFSLHSNPQECLTILNCSTSSVLCFNQRVWSYFPRRQIIERLDEWTNAADAVWFRRPLQWSDTGEELHVQLPPLPRDFRPLSHSQLLYLRTSSKLQILLSIIDALDHLHSRYFHMGFLVPEHIYVDPHTLQVIIDIQPFPTTFPFVRHGLRDYPFSLFPRYSRNHNLPRVSDFYAFGLLLSFFFRGNDQSNEKEAMPDSIGKLHRQLIDRPESFLFAHEISRILRAELELPSQYCSAIVETKTEWLHPIASPVLEEDERQLRSFFRSQAGKTIGLLNEDEATRLDVYNRHLNEVIERNFFFTIGCKNLPLATITELVERTMYGAFHRWPEATASLSNLLRKFKRILQQHPIGNDIIHSLTGWLHQFYQVLKPMMQWQSFFYIFEGCENMDEDSQRIFIQFWLKYGDHFPELFVIFSGKKLPGLIPSSTIQLIAIGQKDENLYRRLLLSQFGRADESLLSALIDWFVRQQIDFVHCRIVLEKLIESKKVELTADGWRKTDMFALEVEQLSPVKLLSERLSLLNESELEMLRTFTCFPVTIRAGEMFAANDLPTDDLLYALARLSKLGLLQVYQLNSVFVPIETARLALYELPVEKQTVYFKKALPLYYRFRPTSVAHLIELAMLSDNKRLEYFFLIKYYRQVRHLLSLERRRAMLQTIRQLQQQLLHEKILCWDRLLFQVNLRLNQYGEAKKLAESLYQRTGSPFDRFSLQCVLLFTNQIDLVALKAELVAYMTDSRHKLSDRAYAAHLIAYVNFFSPLQLELASTVDSFYLNEVFPNRMQLSNRHFVELSIIYTTLLYQYFPEREEWTSALRKKIESILDLSFHHDLMIDLYNSYMFHNNVRIAYTYNQRQLEMARRYGFTNKWQIGHLNGAEISLYLGDPAAFRYHLEKLLQLDELRRVDLKEQYLLHQLVYACEWQRWDVFQETEARILELDPTNWTFYMWEIISRYAAFRFRAPLPPPTVWEQEDEYTFFIDALYQIEAGNHQAAYQLFQQSLQKNSTRVHTGWVYREMIDLLVKTQPDEATVWLGRFEQFLKECGYDLFLPDFYRLSAVCSLQNGNLQHSMLFMRRAANGYELIEKDREHTQIIGELNRTLQPNYLQAGSPLLHEPFVQALMAEREHFLHQTLDLHVIIQLSEQLTESLDLSKTFQRLTHALFEYFPVNHLSINYKLFYRKQRRNYSVSGLIDDHELLNYQSREENEQKYDFVLYQHEKQQITLEVYSQSLTETKRLHMEHFLSFIKPHIANALLYMEMMIDNLTGFYQRRYFMEKLAVEFALSRRYNLDLSLIMIDIDNFRLVNEHGHQEGDKVLRELAEIVRGVLRRNDIPGRYGGEELLLVLPKTDGQEALKIARELRKQIEEEFSTGRPYGVTVSVGVSSLDLCGSQTIDELIRAADDAEIAAKTTGKNRVVAAWM